MIHRDGRSPAHGRQHWFSLSSNPPRTRDWPIEESLSRRHHRRWVSSDRWPRTQCLYVQSNEYRIWANDAAVREVSFDRRPTRRTPTVAQQDGNRPSHYFRCQSIVRWINSHVLPVLVRGSEKAIFQCLLGSSQGVHIRTNDHRWIEEQNREDHVGWYEKDFQIPEHAIARRILLIWLVCICEAIYNDWMFTVMLTRARKHSRERNLFSRFARSFHLCTADTKRR